MSIELVVKTDFQQIPATVDFNFEEMKSFLSTQLEKYNNLAVTEDSIKDGKADKAKLNKLKTALEDKRKDIKKQFLVPYEDFERKERELVKMIDEPINAIDQQLKAFEIRNKEIKKAELLEHFTNSVGNLSSILTFEDVFNERWLNATYKIADAKNEIYEAISKTEGDIETIKSLKADCESQIMSVYLHTHDLSAALREKEHIEEQKRRMAEYEAKREAEKAAEAVEKAVEKPNTVVIDGTPGHDFSDLKPGNHVVFGGSLITPDVKPVEELKTISVCFEDTTEAFRHDMKEICQKHNIKYGWAK